MELIFIFTMCFIEILFINLFEIVEIVRTLRVDTFVNDKVLAILFMNKGMTAMRTAKIQGREAVALFLRESGITDFAQELAPGAIILVEIDGGSLASWTGTGFGDVTVGTTADRLDQFPEAFVPVRNQILVSPVLTVGLDLRKFINLELLILGRMGIIKSPLLERNVSADKI